MVMLSKNARLRFSINNQVVDAPREWEDIEINASFDNDSIQSNITTDSFTFVNNEAKTIRNWIDNGNIFKGLPFKIDTYNINQSKLTYEGFINCANNVEIFDDRTVKANIQLEEGLNTLNDRLEGLTLSYLYAENIITDSDFAIVEYVVEKDNNITDIISNLILGYILVTQLKAQVQSTATSIANAVAHVTGGISGSVAGTIFSIAIALIEITYTAFMVSAIIKIGLDTFNMLLPIVRKHRVLNLRVGLTKISNYLGYSFNSDIDLLEPLYYLPSNNQTDEINILTGLIDFPKGTKTGIPNARDYGHTALEFFNLCKTMFQAKIQVKNGVLNFFSENSTFWQSTSTYVLPNVLKPIKRYNTDELIFSKLLKFRTDEIADEWTLKNYKGTEYAIITDDPTISNQNQKFIKNHETINFNVALGNRKDKLNSLENSLKTLGKIVDNTINFFGGNSDLEGKIKNRIGLLRIGTNNHTVPKIIYLNGSKIPSNHRSLFSAKILYDKYINYRSFVLNNFGYQKAIYEVENLPFGFEDFLNTIENSIFTDDNGNVGKFRELNWLIARDNVNATIEINEVYCKNLVETYIEQE